METLRHPPYLRGTRNTTKKRGESKMYILNQMSLSGNEIQWNGFGRLRMLWVSVGTGIFNSRIFQTWTWLIDKTV